MASRPCCASPRVVAACADSAHCGACGTTTVNLPNECSICPHCGVCETFDEHWGETGRLEPARPHGRHWAFCEASQ